MLVYRIIQHGETFHHIDEKSKQGHIVKKFYIRLLFAKVKIAFDVISLVIFINMFYCMLNIS